MEIYPIQIWCMEYLTKKAWLSLHTPFVPWICLCLCHVLEPLLIRNTVRPTYNDIQGAARKKIFVTKVLYNGINLKRIPNFQLVLLTAHVGRVVQSAASCYSLLGRTITR